MSLDQWAIILNSEPASKIADLMHKLAGPAFDPQPRRPNSHPDSHSDPSRRTEVMTGEVSLSFTPPESWDMPGMAGMVCAAARERSKTARIRTGRGVRIRMPQDDDFTVVGSPVLWSCI